MIVTCGDKSAGREELARSSGPRGDRKRHFATVMLRLLVMTGLASFWLVAGISVMGLLR